MAQHSLALSANWIERQRRQEIDILLNIDAQDSQDETFLHRKPARAVIRCGSADAQDCEPVVS